MPIERLTPSDEIMLWPDERWPQEIAALAILDGKRLFDPDGRFRIELIRQAIASRLHLVPRLRQLLFVPPRRLGPPLWVDDPGFDLAEHVTVIAIPSPVAESQLLATLEQLRRRRLDRSRPLWQICLLTGLPGRHVAMFVRVHHSIADGMAGIATLGSLLDLEPDAPITAAEPWGPAPPPTSAELYADDRRRRAAQRRGMLSSAAHLFGELPALRELFAQRSLPPTSLDLRVGPGRTFALVRGSLDQVKSVAHAHGAKVNDVFLDAVAGGLRALLLRRGEAVDGRVMRIYVPISLHRGQLGSARGNEVTQMVVELPVGVADPIERLQRIAAETALRKTRSRPSIGGFRVRGLLGALMLKLIDRQRVNVESADLPGPPVQLYLAGAPVLEVFPLLPLIGRVSLGVGALSYAGQLNIAVVADRDGYADLEVFASGLKAELKLLEAALTASAA